MQFKQFLGDNPLLLKLFGLRREGLQGELDKLTRKVKYHLDCPEMIRFFKSHHPQGETRITVEQLMMIESGPYLQR